MYNPAHSFDWLLVLSLGSVLESAGSSPITWTTTSPSSLSRLYFTFLNESHPFSPPYHIMPFCKNGADLCFQSSCWAAVMKQWEKLCGANGTSPLGSKRTPRQTRAWRTAISFTASSLPETGPRDVPKMSLKSMFQRYFSSLLSLWEFGA